MARRVVLITAALLLLALARATSASAHTMPTGTEDADVDLEEAHALTDELRYPALAAASRVAHAELARKAERRRELIGKIAQNRPGEILALALAPTERAALPASVRASVEEWVELEGELEVWHSDDAHGRGEYDISLVDRAGGRPLLFGRSLQGANPGDRIRVHGVALAREQTVVSDRITVTSVSPGAGPLGPQRTAIILASSPSAGPHPYANKVNTASIFFSATNPQSARAFYLEASYGQTTIVGGSGGEGTASDVYGPYTLGHDGCDRDTIYNQSLVKADADINYDRYDRIVISWSHPTCSGGRGLIRPKLVGHFDGDFQYLSLSIDHNGALGDTTFNGRIGGIALHEFGHNLGMWHANALECGSPAIGGGTCSSPEYADPADVMGSSAYGHPNGVHKDILGWLSGRTRVASTSGTYTIGAYESRSGTRHVLFGAPNVLKIPRARGTDGAVNGHYYLEYRKPNPVWDDFLAGRPDYANGVLVHTSGATPFCTRRPCPADFTGEGGGGDSHLIDTSPASLAGYSDLNDAPLVAGETYVDAAAGVSIRVAATTATTATVSVTLSAPRLSVQTVVYPGEAGTVSGARTYSAGQTVVLEALPNPGYRFVRWREKRETRTRDNPYRFTIRSDRLLEAVFEPSPVPNDDFRSAARIGTLPARFTVLTDHTSVEEGEPTTLTGCGPSGGTVTVERTVWFRFTQPSGVQRPITVSTGNSSFNTVIAVYRGDSLSDLTRVGCSDNVDGSLQSSVALPPALAGTTFRIQIGGNGGASGSLVVDVSQRGLGPPHDSFTSATQVPVLPAKFTEQTSGATTQAGEPTSLAGCGTVGSAGVGRTVWYSFTPPSTMPLIVSTIGSAFNTAIAVYTGSSVSSLSRVACNDNSGGSTQSSVTLSAQRGRTYYIQVGGVGGASGPLVVQLSTSQAVAPFPRIPPIDLPGE